MPRPMDELTRGDAEALVQGLLAADSAEWVVDREATAERPWGWVVSWVSRQHLQTRAPEDALFGAAPYLVAKSGEVFVTGSHVPVEEFVKALDVELDPSAGGLARVARRIRGLFGGTMPARVPDDTILRALAKGDPVREVFQRARGF